MFTVCRPTGCLKHRIAHHFSTPRFVNDVLMHITWNVEKIINMTWHMAFPCNLSAALHDTECFFPHSELVLINPCRWRYCHFKVGQGHGAQNAPYTICTRRLQALTRRRLMRRRHTLQMVQWEHFSYNEENTAIFWSFSKAIAFQPPWFLLLSGMLFCEVNR